jgi:glyoxylase-like metal-dependent hydrolase (beta-lactamase superfamily II)
VESSRLDHGEVLRISTNRWKENCFVLVADGSSECVVVDPGYDSDSIVDAILSRALAVGAILATHAHVDHIASAAFVQSRFGEPPFYLHPDEEKTLRSAHSYAMFLDGRSFVPPRSPTRISDGEHLVVSGNEIIVHHAPGHTPGGCVFEVGGALFTGDLLIRNDTEPRKLPGLNPEQLRLSRRKLFEEFPPGIVVFPGHGRPTTLGELESRFFPEVRATAP